MGDVSGAQTSSLLATVGRPATRGTRHPEGPDWLPAAPEAPPAVHDGPCPDEAPCLDFAVEYEPPRRMTGVGGSSVRPRPTRWPASVPSCCSARRGWRPTRQRWTAT